MSQKEYFHKIYLSLTSITKTSSLEYFTQKIYTLLIRVIIKKINLKSMWSPYLLVRWLTFKHYLTVSEIHVSIWIKWHIIVYNEPLRWILSERNSKCYISACGCSMLPVPRTIICSLDFWWEGKFSTFSCFSQLQFSNVYVFYPILPKERCVY